MEKEKILEVKNLHTSFFSHIGEVKAVRGVSFDVFKGEALGIVGESGCGKSVSMMSVLKLLSDNATIKQGEVIFNSKNIANYNEKEMRNIRGNEISMIFQDPMTSLNPVLSIGNQLTEHLMKHKRISKFEANNKAIEMLNLVGISDTKRRIRQYPHEFSGGMRQRVMIAISLICSPQLVIADEPTTALDVTIQAQILDLLKDLRSKLNTSIVLITHDLGVVADLCDRINVMYGGLIIEKGTDEDIFYNSRHPYTWGLMQSIPDHSLDVQEKLKPINGQPPDLFKPPMGCAFAARCDYAMKICQKELPPFYVISEGHESACFLNHPEAPYVKAPIRKGVI
jgi:oligopeptide transport system ATP-binding protein